MAFNGPLLIRGKMLVSGLTSLQVTIYLWQAIGCDEALIQALLGLAGAEYTLARSGYWPLPVEGQVYLLAP